MLNMNNYIKATSGSTPAPVWVRPSDWLVMPNATSADQIFVGLHAVIESADNFVAFNFTTSVGQYQVDWGDGNVTLHNSSTDAQYAYDYTTYDPSGSTLCSRGYKQVFITVTPVSGNLLTCNFQKRYVTSPVQPAAYSTGFLDCILSLPNATSSNSITFGNNTSVIHTHLERFDIKTIGGITGLTNLFAYCQSLQNVPLFNTQNVFTMATMFNNCYSLKEIPLFDTQNVTNMSSMFSTCYSLVEVPLFNTQNVTNMSNMFQTCYSLQIVPQFNTIKVTSMSGMFNACFSLQSVPLFNMGNVTNTSNMFSACYSLQIVPQFNTIKVTSMSGMFTNCRALNSIPALPTGTITPTAGSDFAGWSSNPSLNRCQVAFSRAVVLSSCQFSREALVEIFTNLVNRSATTAANINISSNWGATNLTATDRLIATSKNWTITG